jgi:uncharacterized membrane protein
VDELALKLSLGAFLYYPVIIIIIIIIIVVVVVVVLIFLSSGVRTVGPLQTTVRESVF